MNLDIITHPSLAPLRHGFFARAGGASSGVFAGLNCGFSSSDQREIVALNRARAAGALGLAPEALAGMRQVHSARAVVIGRADEQPEADAIVTRTPGIALSVLTADCQPVLLADSGAGVIGAAHAGWRGALAGVIEAAVAAMEGLGARADRISAVIGPAISARAYEVGFEFRDNFISQDPDSERFFHNSGNRPRFDLPGYGLERLRRAGVGRVAWTGDCTCSDPSRFYSYRRKTLNGEADFGRLISAIRL